MKFSIIFGINALGIGIGAASATVGASGFLAGGLVSPLVCIGDTMTMCPAVCAVCAAFPSSPYASPLANKKGCPRS